MIASITPKVAVGLFIVVWLVWFMGSIFTCCCCGWVGGGGLAVVRMDARHAFVAEWEGRVLCMDGCWYDCCSCKMVGVVVGAVVVVRRVVACEGLVLLGVLL